MSEKEPEDHLIEFMKKHKIPVSRDRYLDLAYGHDRPQQLSAEEESMLPREIQNKDDEE